MSGRPGAGERVEQLTAVVSPRASGRQLTPAFEQVFLEHYPRVVGIIARVVADRARAEQLASDVFWKLFCHRSKVEDATVGGWLYRAAVSAALDALRVAARRSRHESAAAAELRRAAAPPDPLVEMLAAERRRQVRLTLSRLKRRDARMLLLRAAGLSYQEIGLTLGLNPRSVGTLLNRAEAAFEREHAGAPQNGHRKAGD